MSSDTKAETGGKKKKGGLLKKLLMALVVLIILIVIFWIFILPSVVRSQISKRTGFDVQMQTLSINPFTANVRVEGLVIKNPPAEFKTLGFVDLKAFQVDLELFSLFGDQLVVEYANLNLPAVTLVRRENDVSNAELFAQRLSGESTTTTETPSESKPLKFLVKKMDVNFEKLVVVSENKSGDPTSREYNFNYKHTYENVTDPKQFITTDLAKSLLAVGGQLTSLIPGKFGDTVDSVLKGGLNFLNSPGESVGGAVKGLLDKLNSDKKK